MYTEFREICIFSIEAKTSKKLVTKEANKELKKESVHRSIMHKDWSIDDERQDWLNYIYRNSDLDFVLTVLAENGTMQIDRKSNSVGANGYSDYGICQINSGWHKEILSNGRNGKYLAEFMYDPYKQIDLCIKKYRTGTKFYGYSVREKMRDKIIFD